MRYAKRCMADRAHYPAGASRAKLLHASGCIYIYIYTNTIDIVGSIVSSSDAQGIEASTFCETSGVNVEPETRRVVYMMRC